MILGTVTGHLWATRKCDRLVGRKLVLVRLDASHRQRADHVVATDDVGAEIGQQVVVCIGAPGRWESGDCRTPIDAAVAAIVDRVEQEVLG